MTSAAAFAHHVLLPIGIPMLAVSNCPSSSALAEMASAKRRINRARSAGATACQAGAASRARAMAASASSRPASGTSWTRDSSAGLSNAMDSATRRRVAVGVEGARRVSVDGVEYIAELRHHTSLARRERTVEHGRTDGEGVGSGLSQVIDLPCRRHAAGDHQIPVRATARRAHEIERLGIGCPVGEQVHTTATDVGELAALAFDERSVATE